MSVLFDYDLTHIPALPVISLTIWNGNQRNSTEQIALVDSGADATFIPLDILKSIGARKVDTGYARNADDSRYKVALYSVIITIGPYTIFGIKAIANENTDEIILGRDALNQLVVKLDGIAQVTEVHN